jgi:hypothetical protein
MDDQCWRLLRGWYGGGPPLARPAIALPLARRDTGATALVELYGLTLKVHRDITSHHITLCYSQFI